MRCFETSSTAPPCNGPLIVAIPENKLLYKSDFVEMANLTAEVEELNVFSQAITSKKFKLLIRSGSISSDWCNNFSKLAAMQSSSKVSALIFLPKWE